MRKTLGCASGQFLQKGLLTPLSRNFIASAAYALMSVAAIPDDSMEISCVRVEMAVRGGWREGSPNSLYDAIVTGEVFPATAAIVAASGVSAM